MKKPTMSYFQRNPKHSLGVAPRVVEFVGVTASGKSTLVAAVKRELERQGLAATEQYDAILTTYKMSFVQNPRLKSVLIDCLAFPSFLRSLFRPGGAKLFRQASRAILRDAGSFPAAANLLRNVIKRIGVSVLLESFRTRRGRWDYVLCDEGSVHIAHNLFVHVDPPPQQKEVECFARVVPRPDLLVWVTADAENMVKCISDRGHRRVPASPAAAKLFVEHGLRVFSMLCAAHGKKESLLVVRNRFAKGRNGEHDLRREVKSVVDFVKDGCWAERCCS